MEDISMAPWEEHQAPAESPTPVQDSYSDMSYTNISFVSSIEDDEVSTSEDELPRPQRTMSETRAPSHPSSPSIEPFSASTLPSDPSEMLSPLSSAGERWIGEQQLLSQYYTPSPNHAPASDIGPTDAACMRALAYTASLPASHTDESDDVDASDRLLAVASPCAVPSTVPNSRTDSEVVRSAASSTSSSYASSVSSYTPSVTSVTATGSSRDFSLVSPSQLDHSDAASAQSAAQQGLLQSVLVDGDAPASRSRERTLSTGELVRVGSAGSRGSAGGVGGDTASWWGSAACESVLADGSALGDSVMAHSVLGAGAGDRREAVSVSGAQLHQLWSIYAQETPAMAPLPNTDAAEREDAVYEDAEERSGLWDAAGDGTSTLSLPWPREERGRHGNVHASGGMQGTRAPTLPFAAEDLERSVCESLDDVFGGHADHVPRGTDHLSQGVDRAAEEASPLSAVPSTRGRSATSAGEDGSATTRRHHKQRAARGVDNNDELALARSMLASGLVAPVSTDASGARMTRANSSDAEEYITGKNAPSGNPAESRSPSPAGGRTRRAYWWDKVGSYLVPAGVGIAVAAVVVGVVSLVRPSQRKS